jgi:epsilon-lactone hydrolase
LTAVTALSGAASAANDPGTAQPAAVTQGAALRAFMPESVSPEARAIYEKMQPMAEKKRGTLPIPHTLAEFDARHDQDLKLVEEKAAQAAKALNVTAIDATMGGVGVVDIKPPQYHDDGTVLMHVHGGGWILGSARSGVSGDAQMAVLTGKRIISVDYTVAPRGTWHVVTDQVIDVYRALLAQGYRPHSIGMYGDSAGGNIVPASVLKLRDQGLPMPGALLLLSACADFNLMGDTETTLRDADPALDLTEVKAIRTAYAPEADWKNPYVSPVYGDFKKGFPPVLLQVGTKEFLLSDSVRLYQAIKTAGGVAELDVYEGMPHVFQSYMANSPEQKAAWAESQHFFAAHLKPTKR